MRIILSIKANRTVDQKTANDKYFTSMRGFLFNKLKEIDKYKELHNKTEIKPFCFGNIFPIKNQKVIEGEYYKLVISSPIPDIIQTFFFSLKEGEIINLGEYSFTLKNFYVKQFKLNNKSVIDSLNFISITKHKEDEIIPVKFGENNYLENLRKNLIIKFNTFNDINIDENFSLFDNVNVKLFSKKQEGSFLIFFHNKQTNDSFKVIGNKLIFEFNNISDKQLKIFQFCFDAGFGEKSTYGAGFMSMRLRR